MAEVALLPFEQVSHLLDGPGRDFAACDTSLVHQGEVDVESRHERHVTLEHQIDPLVVDQVAVLDAADAGPQRILDTGRSFCVRQRASDAGRARLFDDDADLLLRELGGVGSVRGREDSARRHDLDPIRPGPDLEPRRAPDGLGPVGNPGRQITHLGADQCPRWRPFVAVAAGLGERPAADLRPWTRKRARCEGALDTRRSMAGIADRGHAGLEEVAPGLERSNDYVGGGTLDLVVDGLQLHGQMDMAVDYARQKGQAREVDPIQPTRGADRKRRSGTDDEASLVNEDRATGRGIRRAPVEQARADEDLEAERGRHRVLLAAWTATPILMPGRPSGRCSELRPGRADCASPSHLAGARRSSSAA